MKESFLRKFATMGMALLLAFLTWVYLVTQSNDRVDIEVEVVPKISVPDLAWIRFMNGQGQEVVPGSWLTVRVSGPKTDIRNLRPRAFKCDFTIDAEVTSLPAGTFKVKIERENFDLPKKFAIESLPLVFSVQYAKFVERTLEVLATPEQVEGPPLSGFKVESITPARQKIRARVPADRTVETIPIQRVSVVGKAIDVRMDNPPLADPSIQPLRDETYRVEIKIIPIPFVRRVTVDLKVAAAPDLLKRFELEDKAITIEIRGPEEDVRSAPDSIFFSSVVVQEKDLDTPGPRNISEVVCHILDPKYRGRLSVELMPDVNPANRQVKIKVLNK